MIFPFSDQSYRLLDNKGYLYWQPKASSNPQPDITAEPVPHSRTKRVEIKISQQKDTAQNLAQSSTGSARTPTPPTPTPTRVS